MEQDIKHPGENVKKKILLLIKCKYLCGLSGIGDTFFMALDFPRVGRLWKQQKRLGNDWRSTMDCYLIVYSSSEKWLLSHFTVRADSEEG